MSHDFTGTTHDLTLGFGYNPASQIVQNTRSNDLYAWNGHGSGTTSSSADGKNRLSSHAGATTTYDARGNLTNDGSVAYTYSSENLLTSTGSSGTLEYDPLMRFYKSGSTYFIHDGVTDELIGDYYNGNIVGRYVPGAAADEPVGFIDKFGARVFYHADERGSVIAGSNDSGANARIVLYDEYGKRGSGGSYRFAYTGQVHLLNDVYDYKSRNYYARLGRFGQTDRFGYGAGMNFYVYVRGDPVNATDPSGTEACTGSRINLPGACNGALGGGLSGSSTAGFGPRGGTGGSKDTANNPSHSDFKNESIDLLKPIQLADATNVIFRGIATVVSDTPVLQSFGFGVLFLPFLLSGDTPQNIYYHYGYAADASRFSNGMSPGSFATITWTYTGEEARRSLSLPSFYRDGSPRPLPDAYYRVTVSSGIPVIGPTPVAPHYGQPGGGLEVTFPQGTPPGSVAGPYPVRRRGQ